MKKMLTVLILILFLTACSTNNEIKTNDLNESDNTNISNEVWNGPTEGPWETWDRRNHGDQFFKYSISFADGTAVGWTTIEITDLNDGTYEYAIDLHIEYSDNRKSYIDSDVFIVNKTEGFTGAFHGDTIEGSLSGAIYEFIGYIDQGRIVSEVVGNLNYGAFLSRPEIVWEENTTTVSLEGTDSEVIIHVKDKIDFLDMKAFNVEFIYSKETFGTFGDPHAQEFRYIINPDIRFPLYVYEEPYSVFDEFTLIEYRYN